MVFGKNKIKDYKTWIKNIEKIMGKKK